MNPTKPKPKSYWEAAFDTYVLYRFDPPIERWKAVANAVIRTYKKREKAKARTKVTRQLAALPDYGSPANGKVASARQDSPQAIRRAKDRVLRGTPSAHCVKLDDGRGYLIWPRQGPGPRGAEACAIGYGVTEKQAWMSVQLEPARRKPSRVARGGEGRK